MSSCIVSICALAEIRQQLASCLLLQVQVLTSKQDRSASKAQVSNVGQAIFTAPVSMLAPTAKPFTSSTLSNVPAGSPSLAALPIASPSSVSRQAALVHSSTTAIQSSTSATALSHPAHTHPAHSSPADNRAPTSLEARSASTRPHTYPPAADRISTACAPLAAASKQFTSTAMQLSLSPQTRLPGAAISSPQQCSTNEVTTSELLRQQGAQMAAGRGQRWLASTRVSAAPFVPASLTGAQSESPRMAAPFLPVQQQEAQVAAAETKAPCGRQQKWLASAHVHAVPFVPARLTGAQSDSHRMAADGLAHMSSGLTSGSGLQQDSHRLGGARLRGSSR